MPAEDPQMERGPQMCKQGDYILHIHVQGFPLLVKAVGLGVAVLTFFFLIKGKDERGEFSQGACEW